MDETTLNSEVRQTVFKDKVLAGLLCALLAIFVFMITFPHFLGYKHNTFRGNLRTVQIAAESYATDSGGAYGSLESITPYLPGGSNTIDGPRQPIPANASEIKNVDLDKIRAGYVPENLVPNHVYYSVLESGNSYAVFGTDEFANITPRGVGDKPMVLSNH